MRRKNKLTRLRAVYDDTKCLIDRETTFKWGEIYHMFNNQKFPQFQEQDQYLEEFKSINKSKLYKVETHTSIFPYEKSFSWIMKHAYLERRHIINAKGRPIRYFQPSTITSYYHLKEEENILDDELVNNFPHNPRYLLKDWYKLGKHFKTKT
jgi:hypothetical protein